MPGSRKLGKMIERTVGIDSGPDGKNLSSSSAEEQQVRVQTLLPWIHLSGRCLFFAGSQLLLAMEDPAAARAPGLSDRVQDVTQQVRSASGTDAHASEYVELLKLMVFTVVSKTDRATLRHQLCPSMWHIVSSVVDSLNAPLPAV